MRTLGTELRRGTAPVLGALLFVGHALALWVLGDMWKGDLAGLAAAARASLVVLVPVAVAIGAWQGSRRARSGMDELTRSVARRPSLPLLAEAAAPALAAAVAYLAALGIAALLLAPFSPYAGGGWLGVSLAGAFLEACAVVAGFGLGRAVPRAATALAALLVSAGVSVAAVNLAATRPSMLLLSTPDVNSLSYFRAIAGSFTLAQLIAAAGVALAALALALLRPALRAVALVPLVAGAVLATAVLPAQALTEDRASRRLVCNDGAPRVCLAARHANALPGVTRMARDVFERADGLVAVQPVIEERDGPAPDGTLGVVLSSYELDRWGRVDAERGSVREALAMRIAGDCGDPSAGVFVGWLLDLGGPLYGDESQLRTWERLVGAPRAEQRRRVRRYLAQARRCDTADPGRDGRLARILRGAGRRRA